MVIEAVEEKVKSLGANGRATEVKVCCSDQDGGR
jgi:hypothetical protein